MCIWQATITAGAIGQGINIEMLALRDVCGAHLVGPPPRGRNQESK